MNGRDDLLRAHVYRAYALRDTEDIDQAVADMVDGWTMYPAIEAEIVLERVRAQAAAGVFDEGAWYPTLDDGASRPLGWRHPGADDMDRWMRDSVALMRSTYAREEAAVAA